MKPANKIYYPVGLISLIYLPICCIWYLNDQGAFKKIGTIDVGYLYHDETKSYANRKHFDSLVSSRNYLDIEFTGQAADDKIMLQYARIKIQQLIKSKDTVNGIHFKFTKKAKYWNYVSAVDMSQGKNQYSLMDGNHMWLSYMPPMVQKNISFLICGTNEKRISNLMLAEKKERIDQYFNRVTKYYIPSLLIFLLLFFLVFLRQSPHCC